MFQNLAPSINLLPLNYTPGFGWKIPKIAFIGKKQEMSHNSTTIYIKFDVIW